MLHFNLMSLSSLRSVFLAATILFGAGAAARAQVSFSNTMLSFSPIAYWRLTTTSDTSLVGGYSTTFVNGANVTPAGQGALLYDDSNNVGLTLGRAGTQYVSTGLSGGIPGKGSIVAWVNLASLPSANGATYYVAGESQFGNDLDLQFQSDNKIYFFTGSGENTAYAPSVGSLVGQWHLIVATFDSTAGTRDIYWDGALASNSGGVSNGTKVNTFNIGYSTVFTGRAFDGLIDEVGVFNYSLSAGQISTLYNSAFHAIPEPPVWILLGLPIALVAAKGRRFSRR